MHAHIRLGLRIHNNPHLRARPHGESDICARRRLERQPEGPPLRAPGPAGEYARDQAVHAAPERLPERLARWVVPAVAFGTWVWALGALPMAVVVIAPGVLLLQLVLARRGLSAARTR